MTDAEALTFTRELLESQTTLVLATAGAATPLFYWSDEALNLYWLSSEASAHSRHVTADPKCAVAVYVPVTDWRAIRGVQARGTCLTVEDSAAVDQYCRKFGLGPELEPVIRASTMYVFRPRWIRYLDNGFGFGFKHEMEL